MQQSLSIFISYAPEDEQIRNELEKHLSLLKRQSLIAGWHNRDIKAGTEWKEQIDEHLNNADIILLLISSDFLASDYCYETEMKHAMERHERGEARVLPIILRPVYWQGAPFGKLQALPQNGKPISNWPNPDEAFLDIAKGIRNIVETQKRESNGATEHNSLSTHRSILDYPPPTDPKSIEQREEVVRDVYEKLVRPDSTTVVLTGLGGIGKSTLAALIYQYAEKQRQANNGLFTAEALWLTIDPTVTMVDLAMTLFEALSKPVPDFSGLPPRNQALALFNALDRVDKARLIILDQFENLLGSQTGQTLPNRPGVGEWLDVINSQKCACRILITSRPLPLGSSEFPLTYIRDYPVQGLDTSEGTSLLRKQGVGEIQATDADLQHAVERCEGHALALTLLASIFHNDLGLSLKRLFQDPIYDTLWTEKIARSRNLLEYIYKEQLNDEQRKLLRAFSVYREPVPLDAANWLIHEMPKTQIRKALNILLAQHLVNAVGEGKGRYQLHAIVASYAAAQFIEGDEQANQQTVRAMHSQAAQYYLQQAKDKYPPKGERHSINDVQPLIEAIWQFCQARMLRSAWNLIQHEGIFTDLKRWGLNAILLGLYQLLVSVDTWPRELKQKAHIYSDLGEIYSVLGQKERALNYFKPALNIYKESEDRQSEGRVLNDLGEVYSNLGQKEHAEENYKEARMIYRTLGNRREEGAVLNNLGNVYEDMGLREEAQNCYEQAWPILKEVGDEKRGAKTLNSLGMISIELGQYVKAEEYCQQALSITQQLRDLEVEGDVLYNLGQVSNKLGRNTEALEYLQKALTISRLMGDREKEGRRLHALGQVYHTLGQKEEALDCYQQARLVLKDTKDIISEGWTLNRIGMLNHELGQEEEALQAYKQALQAYVQALILTPTNATAHNGKGAALNSLQRYQESLQAYEQALRLAPTNATAYNGKGAALNSLHRYQEALQAYEQALRLAPNDHIIHYNRGVTLYSLQRYQEALQAYEQALHINPKDALSYQRKGETLDKLYRRDEALQAYTIANQLNRSQ
jgi:tetratricopeptide (TPR) repeat protein